MGKEKIERFVKARPTLYYIYKTLKGFGDRKFIMDVVRMNECGLVLNFRRYGEKNPDKNILYIYNDSDVRGFFSLFFLVMDALELADTYGLEPVTAWGKHTLYYQGKTLGTKNPFEYYFLQTGSVPVSEVRSSERVMDFRDAHRQKDFNKPFTVASRMVEDEALAGEYISRKAALCRKYIKLRPESREFIDRGLEKTLPPGKTLGVHVRGTDFNKGYQGHAKAVSAQEYLERAKKVFKEKSFDRVFLATDEAGVIGLFKEEFGDRLSYCDDVLRSDNGEALHFSENSRKDHKYLLGLEVLRDVYTLAACDGLVAGFSNVSLAARVIKASEGKEYLSLDILNNGFNTTGIKFEKHTG